MSYKEDLMVSLAMSKRGDMAKKWYEGWKKENGLPADSNALPPVDSTPPWARPYLFPRAESSPNEGMKIAGAPYSLNPPRIMPFLPKGRTEHDPLNLRSDDEKEKLHMTIYGGKWNKPIR